jgi:HD-GYP domain-containing protein (c-di-GMP phosphodiesterase class II)
MLKRVKSEPVNQPEGNSSIPPKKNLLNQPEGVVEQTLQLLLRILYLRDYESETQALKVAELSVKFAVKVGIPAEQQESIRIGALLHDIGKIVLPDSLLFKLGKLTDKEWATLQKHPRYGYDLLSSVAYFQESVDIPFCHHEHWDGSGYPRGLRSEEIPLAARIFSIVDVWDSLSTDKPYRQAWKLDDIKFFLKEQSGVMFDPALLQVFLENLDEFISFP